MEEFKKNNNIMDGKGEGKETKWITVKGTHIPLKDGESPKEAIKRHFKEKRRTTGNHISKLGEISKESITQRVLGDRLKNSEFGISPNYEKHIQKGHGDVFNTYNHNIPDIINNPDMIIEGNKQNRVVLVKRVDRQVEVILELSITETTRNQIVSMWTTTNKDIKKLEKNYKTLYKR